LWQQYGNRGLTSFEGGRDIFCENLTDDGSDTTLNENYAASTEAYWTATTYPAVINSLNMYMYDGDVAQNLEVLDPVYEMGITWTNAIVCRTEDAAGTTEFTAFSLSGAGTLGSLILKATDVSCDSSVTDASSTSNYGWFKLAFNWRKYFGFGLYIPAGGKFIVDLYNNYSVLDRFEMVVSGFYIVDGDQVQ